MKRIYLIAIALLSMSLLSCQKEDVADYQICFAKDSDFQHSVDKESPKVKEVYGYIMNELHDFDKSLWVQLPLGTGSGTAKLTVKNKDITNDGRVLNTYTREFTLLVPESTTTE